MPQDRISCADGVGGEEGGLVLGADEAASTTAEGARLARVLPFGVAVGAVVLTYFTVDIVSPALPDLRDDLALSATSAGLVFSVFFGGRLVANIPAALLADRAGARLTAGLGGCLILLGSILAAIASGDLTLLPARFVQGTGTALIVTACLLSLLRARPGRGAAITGFGLAASGGGGVGLVVGGALTGSLGWRVVFWLSAVVAGAIVAAAWSFRTAPSDSKPAGDGAMAAADAVVGRRGDRTAVATALLANLLVFGNYSIWVVGLPLFADERFDAGAGRIGTLLLAVNLVHIAAALPVGRVIRRRGATRTLVGGFASTALGIALALAAPGFLWLFPPMLFYACGQVAGSSAAGDLLLRLGGRGGRAVGMVRLSSDVGLVAGPAAVGALADVAGYASPFVALSLLTALAGLAAWRFAGNLGEQSPADDG